MMSTRNKTANGTGTVQFRGNPPRWWARFCVKDEHGNTLRPWVDLQRPDLKNDPAGKLAAKRAAGKLAKKIKRKRLGFIGDAARMPEERTTLADLEGKWWKLLDRCEMKPATRAGHRSNWNANIKPKLGKCVVKTLSVPALRAWIRELVDDGASPSTVRNNVNTLTRFFADVKAERWVTLSVNPMRDEEVRAVMPSVEAPDSDEIEHFTRAQFEALLARADLPDDRFGLYLLAVTTGMRDGELRGLQWQHMAMAAPVPHVRVRQQLTIPRGGEGLAIGTPKTKYSKRDVALHSLAHGWLEWWQGAGWASYVGRAPEADDYVFPSPEGKAWRPREAVTLRDDLEAANLSKDFVTPDGVRLPFVFHSIRHTFASWLSASDVDGEQVDRLLGQSPRSVRGRHYAAPNLEAAARAVAAIALTLVCPVRLPSPLARLTPLSPALSHASEASAASCA